MSGTDEHVQEMMLLRKTPKKAFVGGLVGGIIGAIIGALIIWLIFHCGCSITAK
jgi:hypothetical protein